MFADSNDRDASLTFSFIAHVPIPFFVDFALPFGDVNQQTFDNDIIRQMNRKAKICRKKDKHYHEMIDHAVDNLTGV